MADLTSTTSETAPPAPAIPVGLGTSVGLATAVVAFIGGLVAIFSGGDHTMETITAFAVATVTLVTTLAGRFAQAYAAYRDAPSGSEKTQVVIDQLRDLLDEAQTVVDQNKYPPIDPANETRDLHDAGA